MRANGPDGCGVLTMAVVPSSKDAEAHPAAVDGVDLAVDVRGVLGNRSVTHGRLLPGGHHGLIAHQRWSGRAASQAAAPAPRPGVR